MVRVLSAAVLILIIVGTIWWLPPIATAVLATLIACLAGLEVAHLANKLGARVPPAFAAIASGAVCVAFVMNEHGSQGAAEHSLAIVLLTGLVALAAVALSMGPPTAMTLPAAAASALAPMYVGLPLGALAVVRLDRGTGAFLWLFVVLIVSDSAQYYSGRLFGRRKLAPSVSPAKTIEGAVGGVIGAAIVGGVLAPRTITLVNPFVAAGMAILLAASGIVGDLFESLLKRSAGVKDSSSLIPGHGGVLDRIDSYLTATPLYFIFLRFVA